MSPNNLIWIDFHNNQDKTVELHESLSLQNAFREFCDKRKEEIKTLKKINVQKIQRTEQQKDALRTMFLTQVKKYLGVPYARKYHEVGSPEYNSGLFLDCCGLVRRAVIDLKQFFGFKIGSGNQAYMYDTLPVSLTEKEMKPGDLVFISGKYFDKNRRKQRHDMVHVEVWLGEGEKTIGARWHKGRVEVHESYRFVSKSYHDMVYYFKSIETWLEGTCKSFCSEHPWKRPGYLKHNRWSVFTSDKRSDMSSESQNSQLQTKKIKTKPMKKRGNRRFDRHNRISSQKQLGKNECSFQCLTKVSRFKGRNIKSNKILNGRNLVSGKVENHYYQSDSMDINNKMSVLKKNCPAAKKDYCFYHLADDTGASSEYDGDQLGTNGSIDAESSYEDNATSDDIDTDAQFWEGKNLLTGQQEEYLPIKCSPSRQSNPKTGGNAPVVPQRSLPTKSKRLRPTEHRKKGTPTKPGLPLISQRQRIQKQRTSKKLFFIGGHNGVLLIEGPLLALGWQKIDDPHDNLYYLKWVECKSQIDYRSFREGEQMVNHIPNGGHLTSKEGLRRCLEEYERVQNRVCSGNQSSTLCLRDFYPETYGITGTAELNRFKEIFKEGEMWICKPSGMNQGKGIFLVNDLISLTEKLEVRKKKRTDHFRERIIQRYIMNPLLLQGHKFDVRVYMLIASTVPYMVYYHKGYVRLSCVPFSVESLDIHTHLTNQFVQKKHPSYQERKEDTVWSFDRFNDYINLNVMNNKDLPENWVYKDLTRRMKEIMLICFKAAQSKLERRAGFFDLFGFDFMIDEDMKVWLIEINVNPALHTNCQTLREFMPGLVEETLDICIELFEKKKEKRHMNSVASLRNFELLFNGESDASFKQYRKCTHTKGNAKKMLCISNGDYSVSPSESDQTLTEKENNDSEDNPLSMDLKKLEISSEQKTECI